MPARLKGEPGRWKKFAAADFDHETAMRKTHQRQWGNGNDLQTLQMRTRLPGRLLLSDMFDSNELP